MADDETRKDQAPEDEGAAASPRSDPDATEDNRPEDTLAENKTCPECGTPVDDVRASCINCGYEYSEDDHEDTEAGNEFMSGSQVDDEGNELPDEEGGDDVEDGKS